jgi:type III secretion protein X
MQATRIRHSVATEKQSSGVEFSEKPTQFIELPARQLLSPSEISDRPQLEQIFSKTSIDDYISEHLRPRIFDSDLLTPSRFRAVLLSLRSSLRTLARRNPSSAKSLGRLAAILDEERDLADLLQMYRSALLQG